MAGSGKSTFALKLQKSLKLPLFHLDKYFFEANWKERNYQEFLNLQRELVEKSAWIIDGNCTRSLEMRYAKADIVLYFNLPLTLCYWRVFKRLWHKNKQIDDRAENCHEIVRWKLLTYMWGFENRVNKTIAYCQEHYPHAEFIEINSDEEAETILQRLMNYN